MIPQTKRSEMLQKGWTYLHEYVYAYGAKNYTGTLTKQKLDNMRKDNPKMYTVDYYNKTARNIGRKVIDCSGLVCDLWGISNIGSSQIAELPKTKPLLYKEVNIPEILWGDVLWKLGHVGIYIGSGHVLEAKGVSQGVRLSKLYDTPWVKCIRMNSLHRYDMKGWILDPNNRWWYAYGQSAGEFYHSCICDPDGTGKYYSFDADGYATEVNSL